MPNSHPEQRVLAIFANPKGTDPLRLGEEDRVLRECLRLARYRRLRLEARHAATVHDLRRELLDEQAHVIHFSGHGTGQGLAFEDEAGNVKLIPPRALGELLSAYVPPVHTVVLNACYSSVHADALTKIPYAVVMRQAIADKVAIEFARGFYDALAAGKGPEFAFFEGLRTVSLVGLEGEDVPQLFELGTPVLAPKPSGSADGGVQPETARSTTDPHAANSPRSLPDQASKGEGMLSHMSGGPRRFGLATAVTGVFLALLLIMILVWQFRNDREGGITDTGSTAPITGDTVTTDTVVTDTLGIGAPSYRVAAEELQTRIDAYLKAFDDVSHYEQRGLYYGPVDLDLVHSEINRWQDFKRQLDARLKSCDQNPKARCGSELVAGIPKLDDPPAPGMVITYSTAASETRKNADVRKTYPFTLLRGDESFSKPIAIATSGLWTAHRGEDQTCDSIAGFLVFSSKQVQFKLTDAQLPSLDGLVSGRLDPYRYFLFGWPPKRALAVSLYRADSNYDRHGVCEPPAKLVVWQPDSRLFEPLSQQDHVAKAIEAGSAFLSRHR